MPRTGKKTEIAQDLVFQAKFTTFLFRVFICVCASRQTRHGVLPEYPPSRSVCAVSSASVSVRFVPVQMFICVCASRHTRHGVLPEYPPSRSSVQFRLRQ